MIDLDKITAELTFLGSTIKKLDVETHRQRIDEMTKKEFALSLKYSQPQIVDEHKIGQLLLQISVSVKSEAVEPDDKFVLVLEGTFMADKDIEEEKFLSLLNINGGAALYSIARTKLEIISTSSYMDGKILLPMINMIQYYKHILESTKQ